jgi:predicted dehydrogenase
MLRVGVIGAGLWAQRAHLPAFSRTEGAEVVAICDPDISRARDLAEQFGVPRVFEGHRELLASGVDAVSIVAPDDMHYDAAMQSLSLGLPILCEKPLARTVAEATELAEHAARRNIVTKMGFGFRYSPALRWLRQLVQDGYIGRPHSFVSYSQNPQFMDPTAPLHWKMQHVRAGGGVFVEYGVHSIDLGRWIVGEPVEICANALTVTPSRPHPTDGQPTPVDVDDICSWLVQFEGQVEGMFHSSWTSLGQPWGDLAIFGDRGSLIWTRSEDVWPFGEVLGATTDAPQPRPIPIPAQYVAGLEWATSWRECFMGNLVRQFVQEAAGATPAEGPTFQDGLRAQLAIDAISTSLTERRWVTISAP